MLAKNMFLCDAAMINPDNTFSVFRGGINVFNLTVPKEVSLAHFPPIKMSFVATLELEVTEMGRLHNLELVLMDMDGHRILPELRSNFQSPVSQNKGYHNIFLDIIVPFKSPGEYCFYINVDGHELGSLPFYVVFHQTS
ncbi:MAG: hypothetical protein WC628_00135 [Candidatus Omnitrophota bacterium]